MFEKNLAGSGCSTTSVPKKENEFSRAITDLAKSVDVLTERLSILADKLSPVLSLAKPTGGDAGKLPGFNTSIANAVYNQTEKIKSLALGVDDCINRLEI